MRSPTSCCFCSHLPWACCPESQSHGQGQGWPPMEPRGRAQAMLRQRPPLSASQLGWAGPLSAPSSAFSPRPQEPLAIRNGPCHWAGFSLDAQPRRKPGSSGAWALYLLALSRRSPGAPGLGTGQHKHSPFFPLPAQTSEDTRLRPLTRANLSRGARLHPRKGLRRVLTGPDLPSSLRLPQVTGRGLSMSGMTAGLQQMSVACRPADLVGNLHATRGTVQGLVRKKGCR